MLTATVRRRIPSTPVTSTKNVPPGALLAARRVRVLELVAFVGLNVAVTPVGRPEMDSVTVSWNPLSLLITIEVVALDPRFRSTLLGEAVSVKPAKSGP